MGGKPMRVYYDAEFLEESGHVDVISMGFVREDGKELYFVLDSFDTLKVARHEWLMKNVMTSIQHQEITSHVTGLGTPVKDLVITDVHRRSRQQARHMIMAFVSDIWPEFWAWYGAYDHVALCSLFGRMVDLPNKFPMFTHDLKQLHKQAGSPAMPKQASGLHNALDDARFNRVRYDYLMKLLNPPKQTFIICEHKDMATQWLEHNSREKTLVVVDPDRLRGVTIKPYDEVVVLGTPSTDMLLQLAMSRR